MVEQFLLNFSETHRIIAYALIFIGLFIEGEVVLILAGILVKNGNITFITTFGIAFIATIIHDIFFYQIGTKLAKTGRKKFLFFNLEKIKSFLDGIHKIDYYHIFISKFGFSTNRFVLIAAGYMNKMSLEKLVKYSIPADFLWSLIFISLGVLFAEGTSILKKDLKIFAISVTIFLVAIIVIKKLIQKAIKKEVK